MKKLFFFGIAGCPSPDDPTPKAITLINATKTSVAGYTVGGDNASPVPEPLTLVMVGSGLVGLAVIARKSFKK